MPFQLASKPPILKLRGVRPKRYSLSALRLAGSRPVGSMQLIAKGGNADKSALSRQETRGEAWIQVTVHIDIGGDLKAIIASVKRMVLLFPVSVTLRVWKDTDSISLVIHVMGASATNGFQQSVTAHAIPAKMASSTKHLPQNHCRPLKISDRCTSYWFPSRAAHIPPEQCV